MALSQSAGMMLEQRGPQMFPVLAPDEVQRLRRFGEVRTYPKGAYLSKVGEVGPGLRILLSGSADVSQRDDDGGSTHIVTHGPGSFLGEIAQLSGKPSLVDAVALSDVEAIIVKPERLRALLVGEATVGERIMRALILRRVALIEAGSGGPVILGSKDDMGVLRLVDFLRRNAHPYQLLDPDCDASARALIERFNIKRKEIPIVLGPNGQLLHNPTEELLARCIGLVGSIDANRVYDVVVVGAGPAGLAAAVYAGSEGLSVLVVDRRSFGGQAGASARIENYLGFPTGISGMALTGRAYAQAQKFGVEFAIPDEVVELKCGSQPCRLVLRTGEVVHTRTVVIATGASYRRIDLPGFETFDGSSVHYWASPLEAGLSKGKDIALIGGGNSAGQAIVYLADFARHITVIVRRPLEETMSQYLVQRIAGLSNVEVVTGAELSALEGKGGRLAAVTWRDRTSGRETRRKLRQLFLFIGAQPNTGWLADSDIRLDSHGFVLTGESAGDGLHPLETSHRAVFAIGDVRSGSIKRVASSVGEGAQVVAALHPVIAELHREEATELVPA